MEQHHIENKWLKLPHHVIIIYMRKIRYTSRTIVLQEQELHYSLHLVPTKTWCMDEDILVRVKAADDVENVVQMLAVIPGTTFIKQFIHHCFEIRTIAVWKCLYCQHIGLNTTKPLRFQRYYPTESRWGDHHDSNNLTNDCKS